MVRQPLDVLQQAVAVHGGDGIDDPAVQRAAPVLEQALYATSCVSACLNVYSRSGNRLLVEELAGLEPAEAVRSSSGDSPAIDTRSAAGTSLPITDADCSTCLSRSASRSMRAAMSASTEGGI